MYQKLVKIKVIITRILYFERKFRSKNFLNLFVFIRCTLTGTLRRLPQSIAISEIWQKTLTNNDRPNVNESKSKFVGLFINKYNVI